jgi:hypothetical protein
LNKVKAKGDSRDAPVMVADIKARYVRGFFLSHEDLFTSAVLTME